MESVTHPGLSSAVELGGIEVVLVHLLFQLRLLRPELLHLPAELVDLLLGALTIPDVVGVSLLYPLRRSCGLLLVVPILLDPLPIPCSRFLGAFSLTGSRTVPEGSRAPSSRRAPKASRRVTGKRVRNLPGSSGCGSPTGFPAASLLSLPT